MNIAVVLFVVCSICLWPTLGKASCKALPSVFENNRIFLKVKAGSETLKFYTDSGGGELPYVYDDTAKKLRMAVEETKADGEFKYGVSTFPSSLSDQGIPLKSSWNHKVRIFTYVQKW